MEEEEEEGEEEEEEEENDNSMTSWSRREKRGKEVFVHDRIYNSVADYNSSNSGCRMYVGCPPFSFSHDGITFERFELEG